MQSPNMLPPDEPSICKSQKNKTILSQAAKSGSKVSKNLSKNRSLATPRQPESSPSYSLGNEYKALRKKYMLLEEESFGVGKELIEIEDEVRTLEKEKLALLDDLIVLEGLMDPSELQSKR